MSPSSRATVPLSGAGLLVLLTLSGAALAPTEPILLVHPQADTIMEPILRARLFPVRVPWGEVIAGSADQRGTLRQATRFAIQNLQELFADNATRPE